MRISSLKASFSLEPAVKLLFRIGFIALALCPCWGQTPDKMASKPVVEAPPVLRQLNAEMESLVAKVSPAVVQVAVTGYGPLQENQGETGVVVREHAIGSGVIVDPDGYIITNAHVVEGAQHIHVVLPSPLIHAPLELNAAGKTQVLEAKLIGVQREIDLALLKVTSKEPLPTLPLGSGRPVAQGQIVFAIGSPQGLQSTVTMGIVSSVARQPDPDKPMVYIQTDAPINPGNSGGPLVNMDGYVVGINTFILSEAGGSEGLGFAIPARVVKFVYENLRQYGHVRRSIIRARGQTITPSLAKALGLSQDWGVIISDVLPDGPAEAAGLKIQDIVLTADDYPVQTLPVYTAILYMHPSDKPLKLEVLRGTEKKTLYIPVLEEKHSMDQIADIVGADETLVPQLAILAAEVTDKVSSAIPDLRLPSGVIIVARAVDLLGPETGLMAGDIIHSFNRTPISTLDDLRTAVKDLKAGDSVAMQIERQGHFEYLAFEMD